MITANSRGIPGNFVCESFVYELGELMGNGTIEQGIFIHVPQFPTIQGIQGLISGIVDGVLGDNGDPDGDGRINAEDSYPFDPARN